MTPIECPAENGMYPLMKTTRLLNLRMLACALVLSFGIRAYADAPRDELAHSYALLKIAKSDYKGHRAAALRELEAAAHDLGIDLNGHGSADERQFKSDQLLAESSRMLREARDKMEAADRQRVAAHLDKAVQELDEALKVK
jgi:hypothetical protein